MYSLTHFTLLHTIRPFISLCVFVLSFFRYFVVAIVVLVVVATAVAVVLLLLFRMFCSFRHHSAVFFLHYYYYYLTIGGKVHIHGTSVLSKIQYSILPRVDQNTSNIEDEEDFEPADCLAAFYRCYCCYSVAVALHRIVIHLNDNKIYCF